MKKSSIKSSLDRNVPSWKDVFNMLNHNHRPTVEARDCLVKYLKAQVVTMKESDFDQKASAYQIAGLLSAQGTRHLFLDDPISKVLELAAQVELPAQHRAITDTWHQLVMSIEQL